MQTRRTASEERNLVVITRYIYISGTISVLLMLDLVCPWLGLLITKAKQKLDQYLITDISWDYFVLCVNVVVICPSILIDFIFLANLFYIRITC